MTTYIEYELDDGQTILIETADTDAEQGGLVLAAADSEGKVVLKASQKFSVALDSVRAQASLLREKLKDLSADEVEVTFGLKTTGELGNFAIGKLGVEANYSVKLTWSK